MSNGYGNAILLEPAIRLIHRMIADAQIYFIAPHPYKTIFSPTGLVLSFLTLNSLSGIINLAKSYNMAAIETYPPSLSGIERIALASILNQVSFSHSAQNNVLFSGRNEIDENVQAVLNLFSSTELPGLDYLTPQLHLNKKEIDFGCKIMRPILNQSKPIIGIHAGSGPLSGRRWNPEYYSKLISLIQKKYSVSVILFGGNPEKALNKSIACRSQNDIYDFTCIGSFRETASALSYCDLMISGDTGLMNASFAVRIPQIVIFGASQPIKTMPRSSDNKVHCVSLKLPCQPCLYTTFDDPSDCPINQKCLSDLTPEKVFTQSAEFLKAWIKY